MRVSFYATLRKVVGQKTVDIELPEDPRLQDLLDEVLASYPALRNDLLDEAGELSRHVHLFVDGRSSKYLSEGMGTPIDASQTIEFFPAVAGG
jgi:molybdopterin synthase sulfur carrier subunit